MSNTIMIRTLKAGALTAALSLSTLTMTQTAQAACAWWQWGCVDTPVVTEPPIAYEPIYEAKYKLEDCSYHWWYGYDAACEAKVKQSEQLAKILNNYRKESNKGDVSSEDVSTWDRIYGYQEESWDGQDHPALIPLSYEQNQEENHYAPKLIQQPWDGIRINPTNVMIVPSAPRQAGEVHMTLGDYFMPVPNNGEETFIPYYIEKMRDVVPENELSSSDMIVTLAWASTRPDEWHKLLEQFGHPAVKKRQNLTYVGFSKAKKKNLLLTMATKALKAFQYIPMTEIPGFGIGVAEGVGDDIKALATLGKNLFYVLQAHMTPYAIRWAFNYDPFAESDYKNAVIFFVQMKDGVYELLTTTKALNATVAWFKKLNTELTTATSDGNYFQTGRILGKATYRVVSSAYAIKGITSVAGGLVKSLKSKFVAGGGRTIQAEAVVVCKGTTCGKAGTACFVAGTPVWTQHGTKAIENIKVGDIVLSRDVENNQNVFKPVTKVFVRTAPRVLELTLAQGDTSEAIGTTPEHPFYVVGKGFVSAGDLVPGMVIRQISSDVKNQLRSEVSMNTLLVVQKLEYGDTPTTVYNFTVADTHTYVVGNSQALVHNTYLNSWKPTKETVIDRLEGYVPNNKVRTKSNGDIIVTGKNGAQYQAGFGDDLFLVLYNLKTRTRHRIIDGKLTKYSDGIHGNSLASNVPTTLYKIVAADGTFLKWGITSGKRYSENMMKKLFGKKADMVKVAKGKRKDMAAQERHLAETQPGPLNKEPWAGWQKPGHENYRP